MAICSLCFLCLFLATLFFSSSLCFASNIIQQGQLIRDGENMTSEGQKFVLGFFSPVGTTNRYVGVWYDQISPQTVVWVANREKPILDRNGAFGITEDGNFIVLDGKNLSIWETNSSISLNNATMAIMDSGEIIIFKNNSQSLRMPNQILWRSFRHPTDTFLPEMRANISAGEQKIFTCWTNSSNPSPGRFSMGIDPRASPQIVIWDGENRWWRSGHWNGLMFLGVANVRANILYGFKLYNDNGVYLKYTPSNGSDLIRFVVDSRGNELQKRWDRGTRQWSEIQTQPADPCGIYNHCGKFASCDMSASKICNCVDGFVPGDWNQWNSGNWSGGCVRRTTLQCQKNSTEDDGEKEDGFIEIKDVKLPDFADAKNDARSAVDCRRKCEEDCSCNGYAFEEGFQCVIWRTDLVDMQQFGQGSGSGGTLFVRLAHSELGGKNKRTVIIVAATVVGVATILVALVIWLLYRRRSKVLAAKKRDEKPRTELLPSSGEYSTDLSGQCDLSAEGKQTDLVIFSFSSVATATNYFSHENKLGQGGFGHVYKGSFPCGQEIAVKRLSRKSGQGVKEFTNELTVIAKLQHRNLVRLLGCCVEGEEKMLIYEYMPNKSLDSFLFDTTKQGELNWRKRFQIIEEIARGLLYLHRDSRLRIIHRDLKVSNILLDGEMNPKISDFGMAKIFGGNQNEANTNRIVGTYGYMAPEYAMEGLFSVKSDVYSFGVLLLEIISGRRNTSFRTEDHSGIIGYAWEQWDQGKPMNLLDPTIFSSCVPQQVLRCIQIGLLCVQDLAVHRPNMSAVVLFLETDNVTLPAPRPPTYTSSMRRLVEVDSWNQNGDLATSNSITLSVIVGR